MLLLPGLLALALATGCVSARFHSKTGRTFPQVTSRAVIVSPQEASGLYAEEIGTITARGPDFNDQRDLADAAAREAAANGGTHVLVTKEWAERYSYYHPATSTTDCGGDTKRVTCETSYHPATTTTSGPHPRAEFVVLRVDSRYWSRLPPQMRPAPVVGPAAPRTASER
jgi:hypothetical protein